MKKRSKPPAALLAGLYVIYITITHTDAIIGKSGYVCGGNPVERPGGLSGSILFRKNCTLILTGVSGRFTIPGITGDGCRGQTTLTVASFTYCVNKAKKGPILDIASNNPTMVFYLSSNPAKPFILSYYKVATCKKSEIPKVANADYKINAKGAPKGSLLLPGRFNVSYYCTGDYVLNDTKSNTIKCRYNEPLSGDVVTANWTSAEGILCREWVAPWWLYPAVYGACALLFLWVLLWCCCWYHDIGPCSRRAMRARRRQRFWRWCCGCDDEE